jgi:predicted Zn-dependent protease
VQQEGYDMLATHPATPQRIEATRAAARRIGAPGIGGEDREEYLAALEGVAFGDNSNDGMVRGRDYVHGRLRIGFTAPMGFKLDNTSRAVLGTSSDGARRLLFDTVEPSPGQDLADVLLATWTDAITTDSVVTLSVNGLPTATAASRGREWNFRIAALRHEDRVYRLIFAFRPSDAGAERLFQETLSSIRRVTADEIARMQPPRVRVVRATASDDIAGMSRRMTGANRSVEAFRVLNGLDLGDRLQPGRSYKIVVD